MKEEELSFVSCGWFYGSVDLLEKLRSAIDGLHVPHFILSVVMQCGNPTGLVLVWTQSCCTVVLLLTPQSLGHDLFSIYVVLTTSLVCIQ